MLAPGLVLRQWTRADSFLASAAFLWVPGCLYLVIVGTLAWVLEFALRPQLVVTVLLVPIPLALLWSVYRVPIGRLVRDDEWVVLILVVLLLGIGIGRATWSQGPDGELYGGTISRTLEAEIRSDSRISYNVVMLVAHGDSPYGAKGRSYYAPYNFYARGPLAGLAAAPVVLGGGATPPRAYPDQAWEPFDAQGFATYRIVLMLLNAIVVLAAYGVLCRFLNRRVAIAGVVLVAMSPYIIREVWFTWPKLLAAAFALTALTAVLHKHPLAAGVLIGLGYLAHPSALFALPAVILIWAAVRWRGAPGICVAPRAGVGARWLSAWARDAMWITLGCLAIYASWSLANQGHTHDYFSSYLTSGGGRADLRFGEWFTSRLESAGNTLVPLRSFLTHASDGGINTVHPAAAPDVLRFSFLYYDTLPFAVGLLYFPVYLYGLARFAARSSALFAAAIVIPFLGFLVYWGATNAGFMREGVQFILVLSLLAAFLGHTIMGRRGQLETIVHVCATARVAEVLFLVLVPTLATSGLFGREVTYATDALALLLMIGSSLTLGWITWRVLTPDGPWLSADRRDTASETQREIAPTIIDSRG